uniref:Retrotransposon protein, putative, unclassified n=1 Tax=Tanacetum cinerariifolium TaxID=118510 RepID=A0A699KMZ5_TANCI|nr:retrotransposon protein, putative, unclassified [Tanacetum cinerariifolium]
MFDEYFLPPPKFLSRMLPTVALVPDNTTSTPSSTFIDQDASLASTSPTSIDTQSPVISQGVEELLQSVQFNNDPFHDILTLEPSSEESSSNTKYALETLKKYGMDSSDPVDTLMVERTILDKDLQGTPVDPTYFCGKAYRKALKYGKTDPSIHTRNLKYGSLKSTAISSTETKYIALSGCCAQIIWIRSQLTDYGLAFNMIPLYCDNKSAINLCCNNVQHSRSKHIDVIYHFIKDQAKNGVVELYVVRT